MRTTDLTNLIRSCQGGDQKALTELVRRFQRPVYAYLARMAPAVAEDACQDAFVRLFQSLKRYRHEGRFKPWLFRLVNSALIDAIRARDRAPEPMPADLVIDQGPDPSAALTQAEEHDRLAEAVARLPFEQRQVVVLRTQSGLTFREIAQALQVPLGTALARMHRAIAALRRQLDQNRDL